MPNMRIDERRELLLQAGERVIARTGMQGATTRAVVAEAGMPLASFHYAFASRRDFIRQLIERRMVPHDVPVPVGGTYEEALATYLAAQQTADLVRGPVALALAQYGVQDEELRPLLRERRDLFDARLAADLAAIAESHQREWLIDPTILAPQVNAWRFGSIQAGSPSHLGETSATTDEGVAACTAMLLRVSRQRINGQRVADLSGADGSAHAAGRAAGPP